MSQPSTRGERDYFEALGLEAIRRNAARSPHGRAAAEELTRHPRDPHHAGRSLEEIDFMLELTPGLEDATPAERIALYDRGFQARPR